MRSEILIPFSYLHFFWFYLHLGFNQSPAFHDVADIAASVTSSFLEVLAEWQKEVHSVETWLQKEHAIFETIFVILAVPPFYGWLPFFLGMPFPVRCAAGGVRSVLHPFQAGYSILLGS
jgi:hypothetical protein